MDPKLVTLIRILLVDKFANFVLVLLVTAFIWTMLVWLLQLAARWTERYRLFFQGMIPWVKAMLILSAGWVIFAQVMALPHDQMVYLLAVALVALGISSKEQIASVVAYFSIVWNKPFQIGDRVRIGEVYGEVLDIGLHCTRLRTPGDSVATIPNAAVVAGSVVNTNYAALHSMAEIDVYLASKEDPRSVKKILWEAAATSKYFYPERPIVVLVTQLPYCTRYRVKAYTYDTRAEFEFASDVTETAKREFARRGMAYATMPLGDAPSVPV